MEREPRKEDTGAMKGEWTHGMSEAPLRGKFITCEIQVRRQGGSQGPTLRLQLEAIMMPVPVVRARGAPEERGILL
jgi:hypothetical protein